MKSSAATVNEYLAELPLERRQHIEHLVDLVRVNLPQGYEETMEWGMITYQVPLSRYPDTYNKKPLMYLAVASQKNHMALYLTSIYSDENERKQFEERYRASGKKLNMGKSCLRFKKFEDLATKLLAEQIASVSVEQRIALYETCRAR